MAPTPQAGPYGGPRRLLICCCVGILITLRTARTAIPLPDGSQTALAAAGTQSPSSLMVD